MGRARGGQIQVKEDLAEKVSFGKILEEGRGASSTGTWGKEHFRNRNSKFKGHMTASCLACLRKARGSVWCGQRGRGIRNDISFEVNLKTYPECSAR